MKQFTAKNTTFKELKKLGLKIQRRYSFNTFKTLKYLLEKLKKKKKKPL